MNGNSAYSTKPWTDPDDAPELTDEQLDRADLFHGDKLLRKGANSDNPGLDLDVYLAFRAKGGDVRSQVNTALREWLAVHR